MYNVSVRVYVCTYTHAHRQEEKRVHVDTTHSKAK